MEKSIAVTPKLMPDVSDLKNEIIPALEQVRGLTIKTKEDYTDASKLTLMIKSKRDKVQERLGGMKASAYQTYKMISNLINELTDPLDEAERIVKRKLSAWITEQEQKQKLAEAKAREKAIADQSKTTEKINTKADRLEEKGDIAGADALRNSVPIAPVVAKVESFVPKGTGIKTRDLWKVRIVNEQLIPKEYLTANLTMLDGIAKATKGELKIAGVEFYCEKVVVAGGK